ncbi:STAS domain-containing protein [Peribacillus sp. SCS-26]|uniref:STAS domain-containing protein n=1 Tax=Paraperibacillus marinus TaxID=3115295 RepID=UPI003906019A
MNTLSDITLGTKTFKNFEDAADSILIMLSKLLDINTLFIAKNDSQVNSIVKVLNKDDHLLSEGDSLPFEQTFCKLSVDHGSEVLVIPDLNRSDQTSSLDVTKGLGGGTFIGIPIYYVDGKNYGTICGLDTRNITISEQHIELFRRMASLLTYVLELDDAYQQIQSLSAPFVPITKGVAILPIIGVITEYRAGNILLFALSKSQHLSLEYLIIDLSGILRVDHLVIASLMKIVNLLGLIGVKPILTGLSPEVARKVVEAGADLNDISTEANLERAIYKIGFTLQKRIK